MDKELQSELNTLLSHLEGFEVTRLVEEYFFAKYRNPAPSALLRSSIAKLQKRLHESYVDQRIDSPTTEVH